MILLLHNLPLVLRVSGSGVCAQGTALPHPWWYPSCVQEVLNCNIHWNRLSALDHQSEGFLRCPTLAVPVADVYDTFGANPGGEKLPCTIQQAKSMVIIAPENTAQGNGSHTHVDIHTTLALWIYHICAAEIQQRFRDFAIDVNMYMYG